MPEFFLPKVKDVFKSKLDGAYLWVDNMQESQRIH